MGVLLKIFLCILKAMNLQWFVSQSAVEGG